MATKLAPASLPPPPIYSPHTQKDGTPTQTWSRWYGQVQSKIANPGLPFAACGSQGGQSIPQATSTVINYDTVTTDTDGAVTTGVGWVFTVPSGKGGLYQVSAAVDLNSAATLVTMILSLFTNGSVLYRLGRFEAGTAGIWTLSGSATVHLASGDTIQAQLFQNSGGAQPLEVSTPYTTNWITIAGLQMDGS